LSRDPAKGQTDRNW